MPDMPITFEYQMSIRGGCLKQATVIPVDVAVHGRTERRFTLVSQKNAMVVRDGVGSSTLVFAVERSLYAPQA